jgi:hypothetical protein
MNRKCYRLQSQDVFLGLKVDKLFNTKKEAEQYFRVFCMGCGIISKVRATDTRRYYTGMDILPTTEVKVLGVNEK